MMNSPLAAKQIRHQNDIRIHKYLSNVRIKEYECRDAYIKEALEQLSHFHRTCLLLQIDGEFTCAEIAEILEISEEDAVRTIQQARQQLYSVYQALKQDASSEYITASLMKMRSSLLCKEWKDQLAAVSAHELSLSRYALLQEHLTSCPVCSKLYNTYRLIDARIRGDTVARDAVELPSQLLAAWKEQDHTPLTSFDPPKTLSPGDSSQLYRYEIGQVVLLSSEEVAHLAECIERGKTSRKQRVRYQIPHPAQPAPESEEARAARSARHQLVEANLRLVLHLARKYRGFGVDLMDLVQEGNLGLMHAVEKFDHKKGYRFSTYATWWIRQYITRALTEQAHLIRVPLYKVEEIKRLGRARRRLQQQGMEGEPTLKELAGQMELSVEQVIELLSTNQETISLDMPYKGGDDDIALSELLEDDPRYSPERVVMTQAQQAQIQDLLSCLTERERQVLQLRYGLDGRVEHSLSETGRKLGLSHEAVRQIEFRALRKLDHPSRTRMIQEYLG